MADKSVAEKARVKPGTRFAVLNAEPGIMVSLGLPASVSFGEPQDAQVVCVFVRTRAGVERELPAAAAALARGAALWVFFRKGSRAAGHEVNRNDVWAVAEGLDFRPLGLISADASWSVFRFRRA
jgi:hypothetical protein